MKRLKQHWITKPLCGLTAALLALPAWLFAVLLMTAPQAVQAQTLSRLPTWAVVNFQNTSGYGGKEVGVQASDGFVVELSKTNKYDIVPLDQTQQAITNHGLVTPLDTIGLQRLARDVDADAVATGHVAAVTFTNHPRRATVSLVIRVVDRTSGDLINGAVVQGRSTPRPIPTDDDSLVDQAIDSADFTAVKQIEAFNLQRATVLINQGVRSVTLNEGSEEGLYDGLNMVVSRAGSEVGRIKVSQVTPDESYASVIDQGSGIRPQDVATAIYQLPPHFIGPDGTFHIGGSYDNGASGSESSSSGPAHSFMTGTAGTLVAIAAAIGIYGLATNGHSSGSIGGGSTGGATAQIGNSIDPNLNLSNDTNAFNNSTFVPVRMRINFDPGQLGGNPGTIEYHIYRDPEPNILQNPSNFSGVAGTEAGIGPLPIFSPAGTTEYDSAQDVPPITVSKPAPGANTTLLTVNAFSTGVVTTTTGTGTTGTTGTTTTTEASIYQTALQVGQQVRYQVEGLYEVPNLVVGTGVNGEPVGIGTGAPIVTTGTTTATSGTTTGTGGTTVTVNNIYIYSLSEPVYSNYATYLQPVILREATSSGFPHSTLSTATPLTDAYALSTGPTNVNVTVYSVYAQGAASLQYALQFSTDPGFGSNVSQYTETVPVTASSVNFREGNPFSFGSIDLTKTYSNPGTLYVRVGVRDLRDGPSTPYLWSTIDPNNASGQSLPPDLTPGNAAVGSARQLAKLPVLTPWGVDHVRQPYNKAQRPAIALSKMRPYFTPSETMHPNMSTAHPLGAPAPIVRR